MDIRGFRRHRGFTMAELVVSLLVLSVVVVAAGATLTMAGNGAGGQAARSLAQAQSADAAQQVADDLDVATTFTERTATAVTFAVPDRVSSGSPNTIRYAWAGTAGGPLTRQLNGGTAAPILSAADAFALTYQTRSLGPAPESAFNLGVAISLGLPATYNLTSTAWAAQSFVPTLPSGATSYTITRVQLPLKGSGTADGAIVVRVTTADALNRPTTTVLGSAVVFESQLSSTAVESVDVPFANLTGLTPGQELCVTMGYASGTGTIGTVSYLSGATLGLNGQAWSTSSNAGSSWSYNALGLCSPFTVYGTVP
jgi:prepilin-type N-terminal cleavage/methylation domain-containing protein